MSDVSAVAPGAQEGEVRTLSPDPSKKGLHGAAENGMLATDE